MGAFVTALISGIVGLLTAKMQHDLNYEDFNTQNDYNENMYNMYNSPSARARQLREAGLSDAAIAQALSGFNGSGTTIASSPLQPTNIMENLGGILSSINETKLNKTEIDKAKQEIDNMKEAKSKMHLDGELVIQNTKNAKMDNLVKMYEMDIKQSEALTADEVRKQTEVQTEILQRTKESVINMSNNEAKKVNYEVQKYYYEMCKAKHEKNITKYQAIVEHFKSWYLKTFHIVYTDNDNFVISSVKQIAGMLGGFIGEAIESYKDYEEIENEPTQ